MDRTVTLGTFIEEDLSVPLMCADDGSMSPHTRRGYLRRYVERELGVPAAHDRPGRRGEARIAEKLFRKSMLIAGAIGSGKSRTIAAVAKSLMLAGWSVVRVEPKLSAIKETVLYAMEAGVPPERVVVASPRLNSTPAWNPMSAGLPVAQQAKSVTDIILAAAISGAGQRMEHVLTSALIVAGSHPGMSVMEAVRLLQHPAFLDRLLSTPLPSATSAADRLAYSEAANFFAHDFSGWSKGERAGAVAPIVTRTAEILRTPFTLGMLCAQRKNDVDMATLWRQQGVLAFHVDPATVGNAGARLLAGLVATTLLRTAMAQDGTGGPVLLILDEAWSAERFMAGTIAEIIAIGRGMGLTTIVAIQHFGQASEALRAAVLSQPAVSVFFRLGAENARTAASALPPLPEPPPARIRMTADKSARAWWTHVLLDQAGFPLMFSKPAFSKLTAYDLRGARGIETLYRLAEGTVAQRIYVRDPETNLPVEVRRYVQGLTDGDYHLTGPSPVGLTVEFPKPKITIERGVSSRSWERTLVELEPRHAVVRAEGMEPGVVRVLDFPDAVFGAQAEAYLRKSLDANGAPDEEVVAMAARRSAAVEGCDTVQQPAAAALKERREEYDDESIF